MNDRYYSAETTEAIAKERDKLRVERDKLREELRECETIRSLPHAYPGNPGVSQNVLSEPQVRTSRDAALQDLAKDAEDMGVYEAEEPNATTKAAIEAAERGEVDRTLPVTLIWQAVFNPPEGMEHYQAYRIEYGGHAMDCIMEGTIWLPPGVDPQTIEHILQGGNPCTNTE